MESNNNSIKSIIGIIVLAVIGYFIFSNMGNKNNEGQMPATETVKNEGSKAPAPADIPLQN